MARPSDTAFIAFDGEHRIAAGDLRDVARAAKWALDQRKEASVLIFDGISSNVVDLDFRGTVDDVLARLPAADKIARDETADEIALGEPAPPTSRSPGRPKLGVVAREITLLPRHWEWLARQSGGASVAIRKLVDDARRGSEEKDLIRQSQDAAYRFMSAMAGDRPHFEEAVRALFAPDPLRFRKLIADWPADLRDHAAQLAERAFQPKSQP
ncbi:MAG: DUF2239 family protein [Bradyrhizobium sp.]|uniref:DUF2239 family protein n=1 Tax=Bradyrhizobium sp. TaxID=376 RepID=UPI001C288D71|nr:DUF2239 family protein [Bradyrhizobium sp.]MBU6462842.1 DUF2239 family protein [Pseudomonadota bacterium]MDE2066035.1 DUF2239 family protein [Bradyrhizobium sp.]MDE2244188.1 DUF2239 family protein [Bradyrhizobium sp.]MDE2470931.1 DUF2239 family protein [Bradyrhizobium sp.]